MKQILLTQGKFAMVDDEDFDCLSQFKWSASKDNGTYYALSTELDGCKRKRVIMHRFILGLKRHDGIITDHIDGNGLNNTRANLRTCTYRQNQFNRKAQGITSRYKGVSYESKRMKWVAHGRINGRSTNLGRYNLEIAAALRYDEFARKYHGEFAKLNFPRIQS
jgi:hypothetical protein